MNAQSSCVWRGFLPSFLQELVASRQFSRNSVGNTDEQIALQHLSKIYAHNCNLILGGIYPPFKPTPHTSVVPTTPVYRLGAQRNVLLVYCSLEPVPSDCIAPIRNVSKTDE